MKKQWKTFSTIGVQKFKTSMKVVIIIPTYNERENITVLLDRLIASCKKIHGCEITYLIVDDTSPDGTGDAVQRYQKMHKEVLLIGGKKEGLGKALLRGMIYATRQLHTDVIIQMDADLSHDPAVVPVFIEKIQLGADFVVGSRYIHGGSIPDNWGIHRKIFSILGNAIVRYGLGILSVHDWTGGFRAYRNMYVDMVAEKVSKYRGYVFQIAFLYTSIQKGARIMEIPIHFTDRRYGRSKIVFSKYILNIFEYIVRERIASITGGHFGKFLVVGSIGFIINTVLLELFVRFGIPPWAASAAGAECAIVSNFILNNSWTFKSRMIEGSRAIGKFLQFNGTSIGAVIIQSGTVWIGTHLYGVERYRLFYILGVAIGLIWNYFMYSRVIWKNKR